jgi:hypothetical protein
MSVLFNYGIKNIVAVSFLLTMIQSHVHKDSLFHYWKKVLRHQLNRALGTGFSNRYPETETKGSWL